MATSAAEHDGVTRDRRIAPLPPPPLTTATGRIMTPSVECGSPSPRRPSSPRASESLPGSVACARTQDRRARMTIPRCALRGSGAEFLR
jgi:hypothetical protein